MPHDTLAEVYEECCFDNWDGFGAKAVTAKVYEEATRFIVLLPTLALVPEIAADPDGEIAFEWRNGCDTFSVSVGANGCLTYAGIFGTNKVSGLVRFGECIPKVITDSLYNIKA